MQTNIRIVNFEESELYIVIPLISEVIKDNKKRYTEEQRKVGIGHFYKAIDLKFFYRETKKSIIITKSQCDRNDQ